MLDDVEFVELEGCTATGKPMLLANEEERVEEGVEIIEFMTIDVMSLEESNKDKALWSYKSDDMDCILLFVTSAVCGEVLTSAMLS